MGRRGGATIARQHVYPLPGCRKFPGRGGVKSKKRWYGLSFFRSSLGAIQAALRMVLAGLNPADSYSGSGFSIISWGAIIIGNADLHHVRT